LDAEDPYGTHGRRDGYTDDETLNKYSHIYGLLSLLCSLGLLGC
jgi:hypothetical protein